jgi:hypothetical protein
MAVELTIIRNEDGEVTGFEDDPDETYDLPDNPGALVTGKRGFEFEEAVVGDADVFMEMENAGILRLADYKSVEWGGHTIWIYETDV